MGFCFCYPGFPRETKAWMGAWMGIWYLGAHPGREACKGPLHSLSPVGGHLSKPPVPPREPGKQLQEGRGDRWDADPQSLKSMPGQEGRQHRRAQRPPGAGWLQCCPEKQHWPPSSPGGWTCPLMPSSPTGWTHPCQTMSTEGLCYTGLLTPTLTSPGPSLLL